MGMASRTIPPVSEMDTVMTLLNPAASLRLLRAGERPAPAQPTPFRAHARRKTDPATRLPNRGALLERLDVVATLAPHAPLSFVVVKIDGLAGGEGADGEVVLRAVAREVCRVLRPTDLAGRLTGTTLGIVLQGSGTTAAGAVAARLHYRLNRLPELNRPASVRVSAATGTGLNAEVLPVAAMESFQGCG